MKTTKLSTYRNKVSIKADRLLDNAKATEEAFEKAGFSRKFSIPEKEKRLLFDFFHAFVKSTSVPVKFPPRHLMEALDWLLTISESNYPDVPDFSKGLEYPGKKTLEMPTVLYQVESIAKEARTHGCLYRRPKVFWAYSDRKNRPLIDYALGIGNYQLLNHWGVLNAVQALDECFSESEADLLRKHLEKDKRLRKIKITPVELPMFRLYSMVVAHEGRFRLHEEAACKLPFKVTGVFRPGVWETEKSTKKLNKEKTQNP